MHITKRILIVGVIFSSISLHAAEIPKNPKSTALELHLSPDPAKIVVQYTCDGIITLNPHYTINSLSWSVFGLKEKELRTFYSIFEHLKKTHPSQIPDSCDDTQYVSLTYTFTNSDIPQDKLVPIIPRSCIEDKQVGDTVVVIDHDGTRYDFLLAEDREANMKRINEWRAGQEILSQPLITKGFTGQHAQMFRFLDNGVYFSHNMAKILKLQNKNPTLLSEKNKRDLSVWDEYITWVVSGKYENAT